MTRHSFPKTLVSLMLLLVLLVAAWPVAVQGQGPEPDQDMDNFLRQRIREPGQFSRYEYAQACDPGQSGPPLPIGDWTMLTFASSRDVNWEIYSSRGDGANQTRLTSVGAPDYGPEFNHGATEIAFVSKRTVDLEVHKMDANGANVTQLTFSPAGDWLPTWSPDGTKIAFHSYPAGLNDGEVYTVNADGTNLARLSNHGAWDGHPTWSPDGSQIAFISNRTGNYEIWTMNANGSNQQQLSNGLSYAAYPDWSPDGTRIAFNDDFNGDGWFDLAIINVDGTGLVHPLGASADSYDNTGPAWAPNGDELAFFRVNWHYDGGEQVWYWINAEIYRLVLADTSTHIVVNTHCDWFPDWKSTDAIPPVSEVTDLPPYSQATFNVQWSGTDDAAGVRSYDVQFRDGSGGTWTDWLLDTTQTSADFTGVDAHTYYFRSRARDHAYNLEVYPGGDGDTWITVDTTPPDSAADSPIAANGPFTVTWSATDAGSGVDTYDIQYKDGSGGTWIDWLLDTSQTSAVFTDVQDAHTYYFQSRARDTVDNLESYPGGDGDTATLVDYVPPTSMASSPEYALATTFVVTWTGSDVGAGIESFDIQVRDGITGTWTDWLVETPLTEAAYSGELGHVYYFQSRAHDYAGNVETYPGGDGDTLTHTPLYEIVGHVLDITDNPIAGATMEASPLGLTTTLSSGDGAFSVFFNVTGTVDLGASHPSFGAMPPMRGISVLDPPPDITFYLPPAEDHMVNSGFETGDFSGWTPGAWAQFGEVRPAITTTAHTGDYATVFGGVVPAPVVTPTESFNISEFITEAGGVITSPIVIAEIPPGAVSGTVVMALIGIPNVVGLPIGTQDVGMHFSWQVALTDGTPVESTLLPVTLRLSYRDAFWRDAQVEGEATLDLWKLDPGSGNWLPTNGDQDMQGNTITIAETEPRTFALLGDAYEEGPWLFVLEQEVALTSTSPSGVLSLLYEVVSPPLTEQMRLVMIGSGQQQSYPLQLTLEGWVHRYWELPTWAGPTLTVRIEWEQVNHDRAPGAILEEVSLEVIEGYSIYLPLIYK
jgi:hypothetical protein